MHSLLQFILNKYLKFVLWNMCHLTMYFWTVSLLFIYIVRFKKTVVHNIKTVIKMNSNKQK